MKTPIKAGDLVIVTSALHRCGTINRGIGLPTRVVEVSFDLIWCRDCEFEYVGRIAALDPPAGNSYWWPVAGLTKIEPDGEEETQDETAPIETPTPEEILA